MGVLKKLELAMAPTVTVAAVPDALELLLDDPVFEQQTDPKWCNLAHTLHVFPRAGHLFLSRTCCRPHCPQCASCWPPTGCLFFLL